MREAATAAVRLQATALLGLTATLAVPPSARHVHKILTPIGQQLQADLRQQIAGLRQATVSTAAASAQAVRRTAQRTHVLPTERQAPAKATPALSVRPTPRLAAAVRRAPAQNTFAHRVPLHHVPLRQAQTEAAQAAATEAVLPAAVIAEAALPQEVPRQAQAVAIAVQAPAAVAQAVQAAAQVRAATAQAATALVAAVREAEEDKIQPNPKN